MAQKLILPMDNTILTASWQTEAYLNHFDCEHFGIDLVSATDDHEIYSLGDGKVIGVGRDGVLGNTVIMEYSKVVRKGSKKNIDVICRFSHLKSISVRPQQVVKQGRLLGIYGRTSMYPIEPHLHLEIDTDLQNPYSTPTILKSNFLRRAIRGTKMKYLFNPMEVLNIQAGILHTQTFTYTGTPFISDNDREEIPCMPDTPRKVYYATELPPLQSTTPL